MLESQEEMISLALHSVLTTFSSLMQTKHEGKGASTETLNLTWAARKEPITHCLPGLALALIFQEPEFSCFVACIQPLVTFLRL